jgi:ammonium transporter Rh
LSGTLFLWIFWPSFNAALATPGAGQQRAVVNTILSISASTVTAFAVSFVVSSERKLEMVC